MNAGKRRKSSLSYNYPGVHLRLVNKSIFRRINWESRTSIVLTPEMTQIQDLGVLLLGILVVCHIGGYSTRKWRYKRRQLMHVPPWNFSHSTKWSKLVKLKIKFVLIQIVYWFPHSLVHRNNLDAACKLFQSLWQHNFEEMNDMMGIDHKNEIRSLVDSQQLLLAGDVELNPGPYDPG